MELKKVKKSRKVLFAILSVVCIVLSFLSPITVRAEGNDSSLMDELNLGFTTDDILNNDDSDFDKNIFIDKNSNMYSNMVNFFNHGISLNKYQSGDYISNYGYMAYYGSSYDFNFMSENSIIIFTGSSSPYTLNILYPIDEIDNDLDSGYHYKTYHFNSSFNNLSSEPYTLYNKNTVTIDGVQYKRLYSNTSTQLCLLTTNPIYYSPSLPSSLEGLEQLNYTGAYSGEVNMVEEHMTLREGSGIYLNNTTCDDGDVVIVVIPDYKQTTNNGYKIRYGVQCTYVINLPNTTNSNTISMKNTLSRYGINAQVGNNSVGGVYYYMDYAYRDIDIDEIGKSGGEVEDLKTTNERLKCNGVSISNLASKVSSDGNWTDSATDMLASGTTMVKGLTIPGYGSIDIDTNGLASLFTADYSVTSINYTFTLSLLKNNEVVATNYYPFTLASSDGNTGATTPYGNLIGSDSDYEAAGTKNMSNGGYNQDYAPTNDVSVTGGGGSSSSSNNSSQGGSGGDANVTNTEGDNNVVVHTGSQNVTVNNDNGTAKYVPTILNKLLPNSEGDGGLSNDVQDLVNSNGWVTFMKTTYSFIPAAFWDKIVLYFGACLTITACAFLLRIILDLL